MKLQIETHIEPADLMDSVQKRLPLRSVRAGVRQARRQSHAILGRGRQYTRVYDGGLPAERQAHAQLALGLAAEHKAARQAARIAFLSHQGRAIDLMGLLGQQQASGQPVWALVDPRQPIRPGGSGCESNGAIMVGPEECWTCWQDAARENYRVALPIHYGQNYVPSGIPALPKRVRALLCDPKILRRANRIGVLYQPDTWTQINPDPALVVEWKDIPGKYFALAVWGGDRARIMEWVD